MPARQLAIGWLLMMAMAACGGAAAATPSMSPTPAALASPYWIVNEAALTRLAAAGMADAQLRAVFDTPRTYLTGAATTRASWSSVRTVSFSSYATLASSLAGPSFDPGTRAVLYDNEAWPLTPADEQHDPARYEALAAEQAHAHGLLLVSTPAVDLVGVLAPGGGSSKRYDAYLRLGIAADAARHADVFDIQAQGSEANLATFTAFVRTAAAQARQANPRVIVLAGISTNPDGARVTAQQLSASVSATAGVVDGYWLNIPAGGAACPRCGTPQPQAAIPLLTTLATRAR